MFRLNETGSATCRLAAFSCQFAAAIAGEFLRLRGQLVACVLGGRLSPRKAVLPVPVATLLFPSTLLLSTLAGCETSRSVRLANESLPLFLQTIALQNALQIGVANFILLRLRVFWVLLCDRIAETGESGTQRDVESELRKEVNANGCKPMLGEPP